MALAHDFSTLKKNKPIRHQLQFHFFISWSNLLSNAPFLPLPPLLGIKISKRNEGDPTSDDVTIAGSRQRRRIHRLRFRRRPPFHDYNNDVDDDLQTAEAKVKAMYRKCARDESDSLRVKGAVQKFLAKMTRARDMAKPLGQFDFDAADSVTKWRAALSMIAAPLFNLEVRTPLIRLLFL